MAWMLDFDEITKKTVRWKLGRRPDSFYEVEAVPPGRRKAVRYPPASNPVEAIRIALEKLGHAVPG